MSHRPVFLGTRNPAWMDDAACVGMDSDAFFPDAEHPPSVHAYRACERCDVIVQCAAYALDNNIREGLWGGMSEADRRDLQRRREAP